MASGSVGKRGPRLGRGLSALVGPGPVTVESGVAAQPNDTKKNPTYKTSNKMLLLDINVIEANPHQPRRVFDEQALAALSESIKADGVMQPIVVRRVESGGYELIAGERRLRAARLAGLSEVPAVVREASDRTSAELALVENLQRADLNPVERARAFRALVDRHGLNQGQVAERVGMDRTSVANHLRLLDLGDELLELVGGGALTFGHGRALLSETDPERRLALGAEAARESWSVRETERRVAEHMPRSESEAAGTASNPEVTRVRAVVEDMEQRLSEHLGTRVRVKTDRSGSKGSVTISFFSLDEFDGLLDRLGFRNEM